MKKIFERFGAQWRPLWEEDDAPVPDRERVGEAWKRLLGGEPPRPDEADEVCEEEGDTIYRRYGDRIIGASCGLSFIALRVGVATSWPPKDNTRMPHVEVPAQLAAVKYEHPDKVSKICERCNDGDSVFKCQPPVFGYNELCESCHEFIRGMLLELQRAVKRRPEAMVAALITNLNAPPPSLESTVASSTEARFPVPRD